MLTLLIGGSGSGKSAFAEQLIQKLPGERVYIATMEPFDAECRARIQRHREQRRHIGFETVECYVNLSAAPIPHGANVLLEDLSNLLANELYSPQGGGTDAVRRGVETLEARCGNLTIVSNEIFSGGSDYAGETLRFMKALADLNREIARRADCVVEMVCGLPNVLKGELP
ncbi:MAG: bifunctional adenosylcobinamide kinase/adenosylcobinamide-phosphate guanylyltransferase [Oscillospiraceae bacterium]|nr:bifunctional adenosylcobinamide kinase/adenosylcobinamide-phosphate guanylyltransferase [Oscillospiraceae bacterium]